MSLLNRANYGDVGTIMLKKMLDFFRNRKWELIFSTQDMQKYFTVKGKLMNNRIPFKTETIDPNRSSYGRDGHAYIGRHNTIVTYNILVRAEDIHKANEIIFHGK